MSLHAIIWHALHDADADALYDRREALGQAREFNAEPTPADDAYWHSVHVTHYMHEQGELIEL